MAGGQVAVWIRTGRGDTNLGRRALEQGGVTPCVGYRCLIKCDSNLDRVIIGRVKLIANLKYELKCPGRSWRPAEIRADRTLLLDLRECARAGLLGDGDRVALTIGVGSVYRKTDLRQRTLKHIDVTRKRNYRRLIGKANFEYQIVPIHIATVWQVLKCHDELVRIPGAEDLGVVEGIIIEIILRVPNSIRVGRDSRLHEEPDRVAAGYGERHGITRIISAAE